MIQTRKSINVFPEITIIQKRWKEYRAEYNSTPDELELIKESKSKGLLKLILGVVYFLSLVSSLTILLT